MRKYGKLFSSVTCIILICGCSQKAIVTVSSVDEQVPHTGVKIGDRAEYKLSGMTYVGDSSISAMQVRSTGQQTILVVASTDQKRALPSHIVRTYNIRYDIVQQAKGRKTSRTALVWCGEDALGNVFLLAESHDGVKWDFVRDPTPPMIQPRKIDVGVSWDYVVHFTSGAVQSVSMKCVGMERIRTPAGEYDAYKVSRVGSHSAFGVSSSGYLWISPSLPVLFPVKSQDSARVPASGVPTQVEMEEILEKLYLVR